MASQFAKYNENGIHDLMISSENTRKSTNFRLNVFQKWAAARNQKSKKSRQ